MERYTACTLARWQPPALKPAVPIAVAQPKTFMSGNTSQHTLCATKYRGAYNKKETAHPRSFASSNGQPGEGSPLPRVWKYQHARRQGDEVVFAEDHTIFLVATLPCMAFLRNVSHDICAALVTLGGGETCSFARHLVLRRRSGLLSGCRGILQQPQRNPFTVAPVCIQHVML